MQIARKLAQIGRASRLDDTEITTCLRLCEQAMNSGRAASAIPLLQALAERYPVHPAPARMLGFALRQEQRFEEADTVFTAALTQRDTDPALRFVLAQTRYERGLPAAALFAQAQTALPDNPDIVRNRAAAMAAEGDAAGAEHVLTGALAARPEWLDGHKALATLRWTSGDQSHFSDSYAAACAAQPRNAKLWMAWFRAVAQMRDWIAASAILDDAERQIGITAATTVSRLFIATESGDDAMADRLLGKTDNIQGDTINLCRIRHSIRKRRLKEAQDIAVSLLLSPNAALFWPYLSLVWRLMGDERHLWLDRPDISIQARDVDLTAAQFFELADVLRALHTMQRPYIEQSVRGGTQTDRSVMLRHEPILQLTRTRWMETIRAYIAALPPFEQGHPLLGTPRDHLLIEGSWSVRLLRQGHNVPHTHAMGWLSTAFYIALPDAAQMGAPPAGHIALGTPPAELGIDLPPYRHIQPRVGQTAIFPSTMWHSTVPFDDGERLVLALDVRPPDY